MLGADALTPAIVERMWGQDDVVHQNLGGPRGNLAIILCRLISLACVANNAFYLWLNTSFEEKKSSLQRPSNMPHKVSATSFYSSRTTPPPSMSVNPFLQASITFKNSNITLGNTASPPYLPHSTSMRTRSSNGTVIFSSKASTSPTLLERKITSSQPMASPPSKTLHKTPPIYPVPPLSSASGYFFNCMALRNWKTPDTKAKERF